MNTATQLAHNISVSSMIDEVKSHLAFRPEIYSENEAVQALKGLPPYTYLIRKGVNQTSFYISYVTAEYSIKNQEFIIEKEKLQYQYLNWTGHKALTSTDPYFKKCFIDLDDLIFIAAIKCDRDQASPLIA